MMEDDQVEERSPEAFLFICRRRLYRYNLGTKNISLLLRFPFNIGVEHSVAFVKVNDYYLFLIDQHPTFMPKIINSKPSSVRVNMISKPDLQ